MTYASPNGVWRLEVAPDDPEGYGRGSARYRFSAGDKEEWSGTRPYTLREVAVTDEGSVVGFAYREVPKPGGGPEGDADGFFDTLILDRAGRELLHRTEGPAERVDPEWDHPMARQLVVAADQDVAGFRVGQPVAGGQGKLQDVWRAYRLSSGQPLEKFDPPPLMPGAYPGTWTLRCLPIASTPLRLVHWHLVDRKHWDWFHDPTLQLMLVDAEGKPVWSMDLEREYARLFPEEPARDLAWLREHLPVILPGVQQSGFDLGFTTPLRRLSFAVRKNAEGRWEAKEVGRVDWPGPATPQATTGTEGEK